MHGIASFPPVREHKQSEVKTSSGEVKTKLREHMAMHVPNTSHEFNTFRLWAWERLAQKSRGPDGLTSWILAMA